VEVVDSDSLGDFENFLAEKVQGRLGHVDPDFDLDEVADELFERLRRLLQNLVDCCTDVGRLEGRSEGLELGPAAQALQEVLQGP